MKQRQIYTQLARLIDLTPLFVPVIVMCFGIVAVVFLVLDSYKLEFVLPIGTLLSVTAVSAVYYYAPREKLSKERQLCNVFVLIAVGVWMGWNGLLTSQHILIDRDPAIYVNGGIWLTTHDNLKPSLPDELKGVEGVRVNANGFGVSVQGGSLSAQGLHILPALLAIGGRIFSIGAMLHMNVLFGASALLAIYAAARHIITAKWAILASTIVAVSMPFIYFSRDTYGEPLAATFTFGSLALLGYALKTNRSVLWVLTGLMVGAGTMTRIDGFISIAAVIAFMVIMAVIAAKPTRKRTLINTGLVIAGMTVTSFISMADLLLLSRGYFFAQQQLMTKEFLLIAIILVVGISAVAISWKTKLLASLERKTRLYRAEAAAAFIVLGALVLISRPLWFKGYLFAREGVREANTIQSFSEYATYWVSWYIGDGLFVAGMLGLALACYILMKRWNAYLAVFVIIVLSTSTVYLLMPSIYPDQIWASRRMLPVILPGIAVFGVYLLSIITSRLIPDRKILRLGAYGLISAFLLITPLVISKPLLATRDTMQLSHVQALCNTLPEDAIVIWPTRLSGKLIMPTRGICDVPAFGFGTGAELSKTKLKQFAAMALAHDKVAVLGLDGETLQALKFELQAKPVTSYAYLQLERRMIGAPQATVPVSGEFYLVRINPNGSLESLETVSSHSVKELPKTRENDVE